jgi:hypothetical protein
MIIVCLIMQIILFLFGIVIRLMLANDGEYDIDEFDIKDATLLHAVIAFVVWGGVLGFLLPQWIYKLGVKLYNIKLFKDKD